MGSWRCWIRRPKLPADVREQVNIEIKYEGYISVRYSRSNSSKKLEERCPEKFDYAQVKV